MQGEAEIIDLLNEVLTAELTAVNQYFLDAKIFSHLGYQRLADRFRDESIGEMKDADELIERILFLDGHPNLQRLSPIRTGETPLEKLGLALQVEHEAIGRLNRGISRCAELDDHGTRELLTRILAGEEEHADWLESQLDLIRNLGEPLYLSQQVHE